MRSADSHRQRFAEALRDERPVRGPWPPTKRAAGQRWCACDSLLSLSLFCSVSRHRDRCVRCLRACDATITSTEIFGTAISNGGRGGSLSGGAVGNPPIPFSRVADGLVTIEFYGRRSRTMTMTTTAT